ncbi:MAG TPA: dynamin family protein [Polyangiaceae bacterium]|jgi:GTPase SAR1 family protein
MLDQFREQKIQVISALRALTGVCSRLGAEGLAQRLQSDVVLKLEADRFHLVVVGEFNHGKTTFVNALLGGPVLPVGVTPTTGAIHHLVYSETPYARLVKADGTAEAVSFSEMPRFSVGGERASDQLRYLEVGYPADLLKERLVLVDTPGVNDLSLTRAEITYEYIPRSDAVLFLFDASQPVKESERQFLQTQLIGKSREKIVFVVAKTDIWSAEERREALDYIKSSLKRLMPNTPVFAVSAQAALGGRAEQSGLGELSDYLTSFLSEQRGRILLENGLNSGLTAWSSASRGLDARRRAATLSDEELARRNQLLRESLSGHAQALVERRLMIREQAGAIKARAQSDLDIFCRDIVDRLPSAIEKVSAQDTRRHLGAFLQSSFEEWAHAETREIATALEALAERAFALVREDAYQAGKELGEALGGELQVPSIEIDTFAQDVSVFAMLSMGVGALFANLLLGGLLIAAAPALALYNRDRTEGMIRKRALEVATTALRESAAKVAPKLDQLVDDFVQRLDGWLEEATSELYRVILEVLAGVQRQRLAAPVDAASESDQCEKLGKDLAELQQQLQELKSALAKPMSPDPTTLESSRFKGNGAGAGRATET